MKAIGFIPLRKGSKGILGKNKRKMLGRPLFCWVLTEAIFSKLDEIIVFTDDEEIIDFIETQFHWSKKVKAVLRSEESATDTASTEAAILEYSKAVDYNFDLFCLLQATSPFTTLDDINAGISKIEEGADASLSVVKTHRFTWDSNGKSLNYDYKNRPRRQDFKGLLVENGAVYCTTTKALKSSRNRISGNITPFEMPEVSYTEIDSEADWLSAENLLATRLRNQKESKKITHLVLDVDGVFTDGKVLFSENGELAKSFDMRDGMGLEILRQHQVTVMVMTSENSALVAARMKKLKIDTVFLGAKDKFGLLQEYCIKNNLAMSSLAYVGDDVNDMANMCCVGWSFAPQNAMDEIKRIADVNLAKKSGEGAIREVAQFIQKYNTRF
ncbi:acylneuraminate cytidylyltransferase [Zunongwangia endophytica]|uniref:N-acylneuraminate cytidylyltransferase n=1 Tax=Zunongwangia endophytica TaxID=1808945 RepID=A0ABV8H8C0_9FLAO|nr:acylneuraminate cytidylyltransferase [Zunongwangia endophytica]MDN3595031.1 HAD hydrolase family protein [Zunongwangia endophytica]